MTAADREAERLEAEASGRAEDAYARIVGRPLGLAAALFGWGLAIATFGRGDLIWGTLWLCLGVWGLATLTIGRERARENDAGESSAD